MAMEEDFETVPDIFLVELSELMTAGSRAVGRPVEANGELKPCELVSPEY